MNDLASDPMLHIPPVKKEWNINTIISVVGFVIMLATMAIGYGRFTERMDQNRKDFDEYRVATDNRITAIEASTRQIDALSYRMSNAETTNATIARGLSELQAAVAQQSGDIRVVREILQRIDRQQVSAIQGDL